MLFLHQFEGILWTYLDRNPIYYLQSRYLFRMLVPFIALQAGHKLRRVCAPTMLQSSDCGVNSAKRPYDWLYINLSRVTGVNFMSCTQHRMQVRSSTRRGALHSASEDYLIRYLCRQDSSDRNFTYRYATPLSCSQHLSYRYSSSSRPLLAILIIYN